MSAAGDEVTTERIGAHVLLVTLNRPHKRNAINAGAARALAAAVRLVEQDDSIRTAILTGAGARCFCAGADLDEIAAGNGDALSVDGNGLGGFIYAQRAKPWIAAVRGMALGGGLELALACDLMVAADDTAFALPEVRRGLLAAAGGVYRVARALPRALALEILATGAPMSAARAYAHGMVNYLTPDGEVLACALALAEAIAANAPLAVRASLAIARTAHDDCEQQLRMRMEKAMAQLAASDDAREGVAAFTEKRTPLWSGH